MENTLTSLLNTNQKRPSTTNFKKSNQDKTAKKKYNDFSILSDLNTDEKKKRENIKEEISVKLDETETTISNNLNFDEEKKEQIEEMKFLCKPAKLNISAYTERLIDIYSNIYPIKLTKNYIINNYFVEFQNDTEHLNTYLKKKILSKAFKEIMDIYGIYMYSGDNFYAIKKITEIKNIISIFNKVKYSILIRPLKDQIEMKEFDSNCLNKSLFKNVLELIYKDILKSNPDVKMNKNLCGKKLAEKYISSNRNNILVLPTFATKIMLLESGMFLNVDNKNKIIHGQNCLDMLKSEMKNIGNPSKEELRRINEIFRDKIVEIKHTSQRFKIDSINFDRNPKNTSLNYETKNIDLISYYKNLYGMRIEQKQPLFLLKVPSNRNNDSGRFYPTELCYLSGLTDNMATDNKLMMNLSKTTKLDPNEKVREIDNILNLMHEKKNKVNKAGEKLPSSFQKLQSYGMEILRTDANTFKGNIMKPPKMLGKNNQIITQLMKPFQIIDAKQINFICLYHKLYEQDKRSLEKLINTSGVAYGIKIGRSDYISMDNEKPENWINTINTKMATKSYNLVFILLDDYLQAEGFYNPLKNHSLEQVGYAMQVVLTHSIQSKNAMSVVSNILLQANSKIGGSLFKIEIPEEIKKKNLMVIGVDISKIKGKNVYNIAMCATINSEFSEYTNKKETLTIDEFASSSQLLSLNIASFVDEAVIEYFKNNKKLPQGIIIYRQGVSKEQKNYLLHEVNEIDKLLSGKIIEKEQYVLNPIPYYYVLVNKKTSLKFFEKEVDKYGKPGDKNYSNPECGLLILNDLVETDIFEFYIQPQKVREGQGSATPTNFHVAFGNLNIPNYIAKITYDLCYMYSNWRGPVRVPAPLKYAEKLAKSLPGLHKNSKNKLYHL